MKPFAGHEDPAFYVMAMDILSNVICRADNPGEMGIYLTEEIRELTGARCVLFIQFPSPEAELEHRVVSVNPSRRLGWAESPAAQRFYEIVKDLPAAQLWSKGESPDDSGFLRQEGFELSLAIPLSVGQSRVGAMLVLGLPDEVYLPSEISLLDTLSTLVALVLRNALLFEKQEQIIQERTRELQKANDALRESEAFYRNLYENISDCIFIIDVTYDQRFKFVSLNPAAERALGMTTEQVANEFTDDLVSKEVAEYMNSKCQMCCEKRRPIHYDEERDLPKGKTYFSTSLVPIEAGDGRICRIVGVARDITERKRAEESADRANNDWERTFNAISDMVMVLDDQHKILRANEAMAGALGMTTQEMIGRFCYELLHEEKEPPAFCPHSLLLKDGNEHSTEVWEPSLGCTLEVRVSPLLDGTGTIIGAVHVARDISERKKSEELLHRREQEFRALVENSPDFVARHDRDGRMLYCNPAVQRVTGFTMSELFAKTCLDLTPSESSTQLFHNKIKEVVETGSPVEAQFIMDAAQEVRPPSYHIRFVPERDRNGQIVSVLSIGRDISALKDTERQLRTLVENLPDFIARFDREIRYTYVNPSLATISGIPSERFIGKTLLEVYPCLNDYEKRRADESIGRAFDLGASDSYEATWPMPGGEVILEIRHVPEVDENRTVTSVLGIARDISERKRAEEALHQAAEEIRDLYNHAPCGYHSLDKDGVIVRMNDTELEWLGYRREEVIGQMKFADLLTTGSLKTFKENFPRFKASGAIRDLEFELIRKDSSILPVLVSATALTDSDGNYLMSRSTVYDITERKRREQERLANLTFFESMDKVNRAIQGARDVDSMMSDVLEAVLSIFDCDRTWLFYPCDPDAPSFRVPMEITKPEYPGAKILNVDLPMPPDMAQDLREALESVGPVTYTAGTEKPINKVSADQFGVKSMMMVALYPKSGEPWAFGLHQCSYPRVWTSEEERLFQEIGRRLADALTSLLFHRGLEESEAKLSEAQRIAHIGHWDRDFVADSIALSDEAYRIFGLSPEEHFPNLAQWHERWLQLIHPDDRSRMSKTAADLLQSGSDYDVEYRVLRSDGEMRIVHAQGVVTRDKLGQPRRAFGTMQDITERKQAERSISLMNFALNNVREAAFLIDENGRFHYVNEESCRVLGYSRLELLGLGVPDVDPDVPLERWRCHWNDLKTQGGLIFEGRHKTKDGRIFLVEINANYFEYDGQGYNLALVRDITERRQQENVRLARLNLMEFSDAHTLEELLQATLDRAEALTNSQIGFYHFLEADQKTLSLQAWSTNTIQHMCTAEEKGRHYDISEAGVWVDCIRERRAVIHNDYSALPHRKGTPPGHAPVIRELVVPVFRGNRIVAILGVGNKPDSYDAHDVSTVSLLADLAWDIAERKMAQDALKASEARFRLLYDEAPVAMYASNRQGEIASVNGKCLQVLGRDREEVLGRRPEYFLASASKKRLPKIREAFWSQGRTSEIPLQIVRNDGSVRDVIADSVALEDPQWGRVGFTVFRDVTERKRAEAALLESEQRFRVMADSSPAMLWMSGTDALCTFFNRPWLEFRGRSLEEEIGNGWAEGVHPEDFDRCLETYLSAFEARQEFSMEYRLKRFDNEFRWILDKGVPRFSSDGSFSGYIGSCIDITERRRAEQDRIRLVTAIEQAAEAVVVTDIEGTIEYVNPAFEKITGYRAQEAVGNNARVLQSGEHDAAFYRGLWETICSGDVWTGHFVNKRKDGTLYHEDATISPVRDLKGNIVNYVAVKRDVTEQREAQQALRQSEEFLKVVFENMNSGLLTLNSRHEIVLSNAYARSCLAMTDEMQGKPLLEVFPDAGPLLADALPWEQRDTALVTSEDRRKVIGFNSTAAPGEDLRIILFRDITLLLENEERRKRAEQLAVVGELAAKLSHEIKNPLSSVFLGLQTLRRNDNLSEDSRLTLDLVLEEVNRLNDNIKHVLEAARPMELSPSFLPLPELLTSCHRLHSLTANNKGIRLELLSGPHDVFVIADEMALRRIMTNLIQNAFDACGKGGHVRMGWRVIGDGEKRTLAPEFRGSVTGIFVENTGSGIPEEVGQSTLFRPFFTTKETGTGLGLAVVDDLVERHGGAIRVSRSGHMTVFEVLLPMGDRTPCWDSSCSDVCGASSSEKDCADCEVRIQNAGFFCWTIKGKAAKAETGLWPNTCLNCPVFKASNLSYSHRADIPTDEE